MPDLNTITGLPSVQSNTLSPRINPGSSPAEAQVKFADQLKNAIDQVNQTQVESDQKTKALASGEIDNLHEVMITSKKASITMQTSVEVRNKVVEAYKEIMRMQV
ncbi:flagellar hook-basal body complex protein FliE [Halobacillus alkaliphilus]|uniref:Flagellar hook-basal body complex protein FliE n=1 Tax=Halobacillus alkaliphilus TaxID=396056 RepID=A0A1I2KTS1_9BACI|nr:flagellar hook-basal body complex protein FliE [Halobacillus alkaliphilus]SFF70394.1 flagellar hook-basal body complex protein FliE [Halobacillus alkaliphilus]